MFLVMLGPVVRVIDVEGVRHSILIVDNDELDLASQLHELFDGDVLTDRITEGGNAAVVVTMLWVQLQNHSLILLVPGT